jgi:uncharacterized protein (TIGR00295 family)
VDAASLASARRQAWQRLVAAAPPAWVLAHCRAVERLAAAMCDAAEAQGLEPDRATVHAGALLHDVGRSQAQDVRHATLGATLLRADGSWPDAVVRAVERHTGAGIGPEEAARLGLPPGDYTPRSLEERIVAHADNLYSGEGRLTLEALRRKYLAKGLPEAWARIERLHATLCAELGADLERLAPADLPDP